MKNIIYKFIYIFTRGGSVFSLPFIRRIRSFAYQKRFKAKNLFVGESVFIIPSHFSKNATIKIGKNVKIASFCLIDYTGHLTLGDHCTISEGVKIYTHQHQLSDKTLDIHKLEIKKITLEIGEYVWIGANATILPSVTKIGRGAIIGAGSVVTKDINSYDIVAGNPAVKISTRKYAE